ncbi:hypothetical protein ZIOFF_039591 [Zingiber officinale]|uniref:Uncharacterized protein n=1 Tax=Zingiber officinale TaxID=94328 RepID=A0A8J5G793_ZINOF|nr:hypothetical protein ZIOFF_039591 [Zingiber officinale]
MRDHLVALRPTYVEDAYRIAFDSRDIYKQLAFDYPLLKNHTLQIKSTAFPKSMNNNPSSEILKLLRCYCPRGTVPIRRTTKEDLIKAMQIQQTQLIDLKDTNVPTKAYSSGVTFSTWNGPTKFYGISMFILQLRETTLLTSLLIGLLRLLEEDAEILGALSLVFWSLTLIALYKYIILVLGADDNGEGGTFALYSLMSRHSKIGLSRTSHAAHEHLTAYELETDCEETRTSLRIKKFLEKNLTSRLLLLLFTLLGTSMVIGDGCLTPTISVVSVVSGLRIKLPGLHEGISGDLSSISKFPQIEVSSSDQPSSSRSIRRFEPTSQLEDKLECVHRKVFGRFTAREALLDKEFWILHQIEIGDEDEDSESSDSESNDDLELSKATEMRLLPSDAGKCILAIMDASYC